MKGKTRFYGPDGKPVTLTVGQTFIQVVPRRDEDHDQGRQDAAPGGGRPDGCPRHAAPVATS